MFNFNPLSVWPLEITDNFLLNFEGSPLPQLETLISSHYDFKPSLNTVFGVSTIFLFPIKSDLSSPLKNKQNWKKFVVQMWRSFIWIYTVTVKLNSYVNFIKIITVPRCAQSLKNCTLSIHWERADSNLPNCINWTILSACNTTTLERYLRL